MKWWDKKVERTPSFWTPTWKLIFLLTGIMFVIVPMDMALKMPYVFNFHYIPEMVGFFLIGRACWEAGFRWSYPVLLVGWSSFFVASSVVDLSVMNLSAVDVSVWALFPITAFALVGIAGFTHGMRNGK